MGVIKLTNIRTHAHHGCLAEESIIGSEYRVDISLKSDLKKASVSDNLTDTVDYVHINHIVKEEMNVPSKLLEHVAKRIIDRVFEELQSVYKIKVAVSKINPPIGGDVEMVTVVLGSKRS
ncbi:dihydroneopterin aldolase [Maribacter arenosus]|uniref:7,8-dihydroneopterin aldolase n=1 Tax=Maribacter arenosus TaxID=1854708 RepID=A0ABR7VBY9_9FLAO|nr:dihydroneopterin aldolase [Maribacter arenosus]MBD0851200.1 dihydroneopterin aldolase [Maribacter arenosus]